MVENPMVNDRIWKEQEKLPKIIGECAGCQEDIQAGEDIFELNMNGQEVLVHQKEYCCFQLIGDIGLCKLAGE